MVPPPLEVTSQPGPASPTMVPPPVRVTAQRRLAYATVIPPLLRVTAQKALHRTGPPELVSHFSGADPVPARSHTPLSPDPAQAPPLLVWPRPRLRAVPTRPRRAHRAGRARPTGPTSSVCSPGCRSRRLSGPPPKTWSAAAAGKWGRGPGSPSLSAGQSPDPSGLPSPG